MKNATIGAVVIPPEQIKKAFSNEIAKKYIVVEVAIYPEEGSTFDVDELSFALRTRDEVLQTSETGDVAGVWGGNPNPVGHRGPSIYSDSGIVIARETDPLTGKPRTSVGHYEGVAVTNYPQPPSAPTPPPKNAGATEYKLRDAALPHGPAKKAVAGYLYFRPRGKKHEPFTLNYSKDDVSLDLKLPNI